MSHHCLSAAEQAPQKTIPCLPRHLYQSPLPFGCGASSTHEDYISTNAQGRVTIAFRLRSKLHPAAPSRRRMPATVTIAFRLRSKLHPAAPSRRRMPATVTIAFRLRSKLHESAKSYRERLVRSPLPFGCGASSTFGRSAGYYAAFPCHHCLSAAEQAPLPLNTCLVTAPL